MTASRSRVDAGRVIVVAFAVLAFLQCLVRVLRGVDEWTSGHSWAAWSGAVLTCAFYVLMIRAYLRRGRALASSRRPVPNAAAVAGTLLPLVFPWLPGGTVPGVRLAAADLCLVVGLLWSLWSLRTLGRSLSIIPQARSVVSSGPYRWIRHPLYAGEVLSVLGVALSLGGVTGLLVWCALVVLQGYRAVCEERVLVGALPEYRAYQDRTSRIVPGLF